MLTFDLESIKFSDDYNFSFRGRSSGCLYDLDLELSSICYFSNGIYCPDSVLYFQSRSDLINSKLSDLSLHDYLCVKHIFLFLKRYFVDSIPSLRFCFNVFLEHFPIRVAFHKKTNQKQFLIIFLYSYYCSILYHYNGSFTLTRESSDVNLDSDSDSPF